MRTIARRIYVRMREPHWNIKGVYNPRRACAARVTVVVVCVCRLVANSLLKGQFVLKTLSHTQRATKVKKFVGFSRKPLRCRDTALARCTATRAVGHFYAHAHIWPRPCARACVVASNNIRRSMRTCARKSKSSTQHQATRQSSTASQQLYVKMQIFFGMNSF